MVFCYSSPCGLRQTCVCLVSLTLVISYLYDHSHSNRPEALSHWVLVYISLMISKVEHLCMYLLDIFCLLWKNVYLDPLPIFKIRLFFLLLTYMSSLYILDIKPFQIYALHFFSHSVGCLFILLVVSFAVQKIFSLM